MKIAFALLLTLSLLAPRGFAKARPKAPSVIDMSAIEGDAPTGLISTELSGHDVQFFLSAFEIGTLETWLGGQAKARGESDKVKAVGDALQSTQTEETGLLLRLAKRKGVALGTPKVPVGRQKEAMAQLAPLKGASFDTAVMEQITAATQQATEVYADAAQSADPDIKHFAAQILPMAREKLTLASRVSGKPVPPGAKPGFRENPPVVPPPPAPPSPPLATPIRRVPASPPPPPPPHPMVPAQKAAATPATPAPASPAHPRASASPAVKPAASTPSVAKPSPSTATPTPPTPSSKPGTPPAAATPGPK